MTEPPAEPLPRAINSPRQILAASLVGTAIEFFDFYIYATAAVRFGDHRRRGSLVQHLGCDYSGVVHSCPTAR